LGSSDVVGGCLSENDGEASFQMPIDVAMQEPGTRISGEEPKRSIATVDRIDITTEWVDEVNIVIIRWAYNIERVTVQTKSH